MTEKRETDRDLMPRFTEGRLAAPPSQLFQEIITSPAVMALRDPRRFTANIVVDLAHTVMLGEQEIISRQDAGAIGQSLLELLDSGPESISLDTSRDDTLFQIEEYLAQEVGPDVAGRMHTGRSRTDRSAAIMRYQLRGDLLEVIDALLGWQEALLAKGDEHRDTVLPGYTHMQQAQATTFGHHLLAQFWLHMDDLERLQLAYRHTAVNPLGTASVSGTSWPLDRDRTQELLGFETSTENARVSRTYIYRAEVATAYATLMTTLHYLASDFFIWYSHEFGMVEPADEHSGSRSIMPQKKNPPVWEHTRVTARHASGWASSALAALMGANSSDSSLESPEIERYGPIVTGILRINREVLERLMVDKERMLELVREGFSTANDLAGVLVRERGMPFRQAHNVVARLVRLCTEDNVAPDAVQTSLLDRAARELGEEPPDLDQDTVSKALDPVHFVYSRTTRGSANPEDVKRQIELGRAALEDSRRWLQEIRERVDGTDARLREAVAALRP